MRDRELILGVLAAKMRLVSPAQLEAASMALVDEQDRSLLTFLQDSGALTPNQRELLEAMADAALAASEGKPDRVLASLDGSTIASLTPGAAEPPGSTSPTHADRESRIPPEREGQYSRLGELGRGSQSVVVLARDRFIGREVALKELLPPSLGPATPGPAAVVRPAFCGRRDSSPSWTIPGSSPSTSSPRERMARSSAPRSSFAARPSRPISRAASRSGSGWPSFRISSTPPAPSPTRTLGESSTET